MGYISFRFYASKRNSAKLCCRLKNMASASDSDSSVEDESQRQRLLEAAVDARIIIKSSQPRTGSADMKPGVSKNGPAELLTAPSKRLSTVDQQEQENVLNTTPEFRAFVAKKLSQMLDKEIEDEQRGKRLDQSSVEYEDTGIRLFCGSTRILKTDCTPEDLPVPRRRPVQKKRSHNSSSGSSSEDERLAAAAVSHDFIIQQSKIVIGSHDKVLDATQANDHKRTEKLTTQTDDNTNVRIKNPSSVDCCKDSTLKKKKKKHKNIKEIKD